MILRDVRSSTRAGLAMGAALALSLLGVGAVRAQEPAAPPMRPATHTVKRGDTLWDLAKLYLGDAFLWPEIYRINTDKIEDPHWIYPGEVLKLPTETVKAVAVAPAPAPSQPLAVVTPVEPMPRQPAPQTEQAPPPLMQPQIRTVRLGEYTAAPWVEARGGPKGSGFIMAARDLPGIASADQSRISLYDAVVVAPPAGASAQEHTRYISYRLGPLIEDFGQIVIPTGIVEITRAPRNGEAAIGRVVRMFGTVEQNQRLLPYDSSAAIVTARPSAVANGKTGKVRWILSKPVLPSVQAYVVIDIGRQDVTTGDQIDLYYPGKKAKEGQDYGTPEVWIASAQVLRVTPFGATAIITSQQQPKIEEGTAARVAAKMP